MINSKNFFNGQSLFEVLFAIAIAAIILTGVVSLAAKSISNTTSSRETSIATFYSQEALEWLRGERDASWTTFVGREVSPGPTWCLQDLSWDNSGNCNATEFVDGSNFLRREVFFDLINADSVEVTVSIIWIDAQGMHTESAVTRFTNWKAPAFSP